MRQILKNNILYLLLIFLVTTVTYSPTLHADFVSADDLQGYVNNPLVRNFDYSLKHWDLLIYYTIMYKLFALNAAGLHVSALIVHMLNITLAFVFIYITFGKKIAAIATPIFALHPAISEAVMWISAISYPALFTFSFLTLIPYVLFRQSSKKHYLYLSIFFYLILLIVVRHPWVLVTFPILFLVDYFYLEKLKINNFVPYIIFTIIHVLLVVLPNTSYRVEALAGLYTESQGTRTPWIQRLPMSIYKPTSLYIWPQKLSLFHIQAITSAKYIFIVFVSLAVTVSCVVLFKKNKKYAGLILIILASLGATFSPVQIGWISAERYMYLGAPFFAVLVAFFLTDILKSQKSIIYITVLISSMFMVRTYVRANDWTSNLNLWLATQKTAPTSTRVYNNLGDAFGNAGRQDLAIKAFETAIQIDPNYADATHNLGNTYLQIGDYENAKLYLQKSFELNPYLYQSTYKLGLIAYQEQNIELAKKYFEQTLQINPNYEPAQQALVTLQGL